MNGTVPATEEDLLQIGQGILQREAGDSVKLIKEHSFGRRYRSAVIRCSTHGGSAGTPGTVIVKRSTPVSSQAAAEDLKRFRTEVGALRYLESLAITPSVSPRIFGSDEDSVVMAIEDLGPGAALSDVLLGTDPEAAESALLAYARSLGRLHAATAGRIDEYRHANPTLVAETGLPNTHLGWTTDDVKTRAVFEAVAEELGISLDAGWRTDMEMVERPLADAGPYLTFNVSDVCPDNHLIAEDGQGVRFFDLEFAGFGHALIDGSYLSVPFPTCWCVARLPPAAREGAIEIYRRALAAGIPEARDRESFARENLMLTVGWAVQSTAWNLRESLTRDEEWGEATHRQRVIYRLESAAADCGQLNLVPSIALVFRAMAEILRCRWTETDLDVPLYPAFR